MFLNLLFRHIEGQVPQKQNIMPLLLLLFLLFRNLIIRFAFWLCFGLFLLWFLLFYWLLCWCDISTGLPLLWPFWFRLCRNWGDCSEDEALATLNNLGSIRNFFCGPRFCVLFWILWKKKSSYTLQFWHFSFKKTHLKMLSAKYWPFHPGLKLNDYICCHAILVIITVIITLVPYHLVKSLQVTEILWP